MYDLRVNSVKYRFFSYLGNKIPTVWRWGPIPPYYTLWGMVLGGKSVFMKVLVPLGDLYMSRLSWFWFYTHVVIHVYSPVSKLYQRVFLSGEIAQRHWIVNYDGFRPHAYVNSLKTNAKYTHTKNGIVLEVSVFNISIYASGGLIE